MPASLTSYSITSNEGHQTADHLTRSTISSSMRNHGGYITKVVIYQRMIPPVNTNWDVIKNTHEDAATTSYGMERKATTNR